MYTCTCIYLGDVQPIVIDPRSESALVYSSPSATNTLNLRDEIPSPLQNTSGSATSVDSPQERTPSPEGGGTPKSSTVTEYNYDESTDCDSESEFQTIPEGKSPNVLPNPYVLLENIDHLIQRNMQSKIVDLTNTADCDDRSQKLEQKWEKLQNCLDGVVEMSQMKYLSIKNGDLCYTNEVFAMDLMNSGRVMYNSGINMYQTGEKLMSMIKARRLLDLKSEGPGRPVSETQPVPSTSHKLPKERISGKWWCEVCGKSFQDKRSLQSCLLKHEGKSFLCIYCDKKFTSHNSMKLHVEGHEQGPFRCSVCDEEFSMRQNRDRHEKSHYQKKRFQCKYCGKSYADKYGLQGHLPKHEMPPKSYKCQFCHSGHDTPGALRTHLFKEHPGRK